MPSVHLIDSPPPDPQLEEVAVWLKEQSNLVDRFRKIVRQGIDEVLDGGRTGRYTTAQLAKTEKTYIGTKIEILVRDEFRLPSGPPLDTSICGHPVDIKWSITNSQMIARENVGHICLLVGARELARADSDELSVSLLRPRDEDLTRENQDKKRGIASHAKRYNLVPPGTDLPRNFLATLDDETRREVMNKQKGQPRVTELFLRVQRRPIPRLTIETVACQYDSMRRTRQDKSDRLGGVRVVSGAYKRQQIIAAALGVPGLKRDEFVSFPAHEYAEAEAALIADGQLPPL